MALEFDRCQKEGYHVTHSKISGRQEPPMKLKYVPWVWLFALMVMVISCSPSPSDTTSSTMPASSVPIHGGILRILTGSEPVMLGYYPLMGAEDVSRVAPGAEKLMAPNLERELKPFLAERVEEDVENKLIIFYIRPGVKFHDGSVLDADVVIWNFEVLLNKNHLVYADYLESIEKIDDMTVQMNLTEYSNQLIFNWGRIPIFSQRAWEEASQGDEARGIDWARTHCVGTGPFKLNEFEQGVQMTWVKNADYWQQGKPYLDSIVVQFIASNPTARMKMLAGEADLWEFSYSLELEEHGFDIWRSWYGVVLSIWPNTADPDSRWNDIRLRQALELAIDKKAVTDAFGPDTFYPLDMIVRPDDWGYDPSYPFRTYDPEKARQMVIEAGYPDGLDAELLLGTAYGGELLGVTVQDFLDDIGIRIDIDLADPGRFFHTIYAEPGPDLVITYSSVELNGLMAYLTWFGSESLVKIAYLGHNESEKPMEQRAILARGPEEQQAAAQELIRYATDQAKVIPLMWFAMRQVVAPYVHGPLPVLATWHTEDLWMEE